MKPHVKTVNINDKKGRDTMSDYEQATELLKRMPPSQLEYVVSFSENLSSVSADTVPFVPKAGEDIVQFLMQSDANVHNSNFRPAAELAAETRIKYEI